MSPTIFSLDPGIAPQSLAEALAAQRRIRIRNFLAPPMAETLRKYLLEAGDWRHVINGGERVFETPREELNAMPEADRRAIDLAIFRQAAHTFQFRYDTIRVPDDREERRRMGSPLSDFAQFMSAPDTLQLFREITGRDDIMFADAQATRYQAGDFLTRHDDRVGGKHRSHAFVLGLTPEWLPEWGGLLLFNGSDGQILEALTPSFNCLDLFPIGEPHSVSYVAPYAPSDRISVTGWLRTALP